MIQTSNFTNAGKLPNAVAISQGVPTNWAGRRYRALAPPWCLVKEKSESTFRELYRTHILDKLDARKVVQELDEAILLCWEKPGRFCHRRMVAEWIELMTGITVPEYMPPVVERPREPQGDLFL